MKTIATIIIIMTLSLGLNAKKVLDYNVSNETTLIVQYSCDGIYWYNYKKVNVEKGNVKIIINNREICDYQLRIIQQN